MLNVPGHKRIVNRKRANLREVNRWDLRRGLTGSAANNTVSYMNLPTAPGTILQEKREKQLLNFLQTAQTQQQQQVAQQVAAQNAATQTAIQQALQQALAQQTAAQQAAIQQAAQQTAQQVVQQQTQAAPPQSPAPAPASEPEPEPAPSASPQRRTVAQRRETRRANRGTTYGNVHSTQGGVITPAQQRRSSENLSAGSPAQGTPAWASRPQASPTPRSSLAQQFEEQIANQPARQYNSATGLPIANRPARTGSVLELARSNLRP